jgi:hypothetical protein
MKPRVRFTMGILAAGVAALLTAMPVGAQSNSQPRVARLSFVEGEVTVERPDLPVWAEAPVNTPLQEGFKLSTGEGSFAEIQFENGSSIRLGQLALIDFTELGLAPNGAKVNHVELRQGYATFHPLPSRLGESLQVGTPNRTLIAQGGTRFRVDLDKGLERVEVFTGALEVQSNLGATTLEKDSVLVMQPGAPEPTVVSQGITKDDWDQWVDDRETHAQMEPAGPSPNTYTDDDADAEYGWSDLMQYGTWSNVPGAGYGWTPTMVASGWAPYASGRWCWYPGWGYIWIGAEPWGWLPYHYGGWEFIPGRGWVWFPGNFRTWSPGRVTWFHGPDWVGWIPRPRGSACATNCGGGAVSTSTFRRGGLLTAGLMLGINPTTGNVVKEPGIVPSMAAKLPGQAVSLPAAQSPWLRPGRAPAEAGIPATASTSPGLRQAGATHSNAAIVYDPQENSYVNGRRVTKPQGPPASPSGASALDKPAENSGLVQPVPVGSREPSARPTEDPGQNPGTGVSMAKPAPAGPRGNADPHPANSSAGQEPSAPRTGGGGGQGARSHGGGSAPAQGHSSSAPSGGGHASSAPAGGGSPGGHH